MDHFAKDNFNEGKSIRQESDDSMNVIGMLALLFGVVLVLITINALTSANFKTPKSLSAPIVNAPYTLNDYVEGYHTVENFRVIDGDTIEATLNLGFDTVTTKKIRLIGIDAPEMRGEEKIEGQAAKEHLINLLNAAQNNIILYTQDYNQDKYGRYLGTFYANGKNVNMKMLEDGHAESYK